MTPRPAVHTERATKTYGSGALAVHALRESDLTIERGKLVVVLGPSGSGKTTLLELLGAIAAPTSGRVVVGGHDLTALDERGRTAFRRSTVGFVFQFFNLIPSLTARENVELVLELTGKGGRGSATPWLHAVGLAERADHFPNKLSGGEQQRVAIARAIAKEPEVLLCDEPTGSLDVDTGRDVLALLQGLNRERGCTTLVVTHNSAIASMADVVVHMHSGALVEHYENPSPVPAESLQW